VTEISFCVPVYNNADVAEKVANALLESQSDSIQVVFSDAGSTDDTRSRLEKIDDKRLKVVGFDELVDCRKNWLNALENGDGDWLYLVMGRDRMDMAFLDRLLAILSRAQEEGLLVVKDKQVGQMETGKAILYDRLASYMELLIYDHPTGLIVSREALKTAKSKAEFFNTDYIYPENYLIQELVQITGKSMKFCSGVNSGQIFIDRGKELSKAVKIGEEESLFWFPKKRTDHTIRVIKMVENDENLSLADMGNIFLQKLDWMHLAVHMWKDWITYGADFAKHYGVKQRYISPEEEAGKVAEAFSDILNEFSTREWCTPDVIERAKNMTMQHMLRK